MHNPEDTTLDFVYFKSMNLRHPPYISECELYLRRNIANQTNRKHDHFWV